MATPAPSHDIDESSTHPKARRSRSRPSDRFRRQPTVDLEFDRPSELRADPVAPPRRLFPSRSAAPRITNALTIDLEDWPIAVLGSHHDITSRVVKNTKRCLQLLDWHGVRATFFVLSRVAEKFPDLIREVHSRGHEIASHGHAHELLFRMTPAEFADDVKRSVEILTRITGQRPIGYRAPAFSIVEKTRWAGPILADLGFKYDSSIFPIRHPRYGIPGAPRRIHRWPDCDLIECPPATCRVLGTNVPVAGGGYFRLLPGPLARSAIHRINRERMPAILYLHPYELDVGGIFDHRCDGVRVGNARHFTQALFRSRMESRLHRLMEHFQFAPLQQFLGAR